MVRVKSLMASVAVVGLLAASPSFAADFGGRDAVSMKDDYVAPVSNLWERPYVAVYAAYVAANTDWAWTDYYDSCDDHDKCGHGLDQDGWGGGLAIGKNFAVNGLLLGVEADFTFTDIESDAAFDGKNALSSEMEYLATIRGKVGALVDPSMYVYATGGVAFAKWNDAGVLSSCSGFCTDDFSDDGWETGYAAGLGFEKVLGQTMRIRAEYIYAGGFDDRSWYEGDVKVEHNDIHQIRLGLTVPLQ